jgi:excisionase family DNA binding protein
MISIAEAAARLGISERRLQTLCAQRRIPGARLVHGRVWELPEHFTITPGSRGPRLTRGNV